MAGLPDFRKLWDFRKPAETEERFRKILPEVEASGDLNYKLELQTQIARTFGLRQNFDAAHALLDEVESELTSETQLARLRFLLERGRAYNSGGNPDEARRFFQQAWDLGREIEAHALAVDAAHMMAILPPVESQAEWNRHAMEYAEKSGDPDAMKWLGTLYNNMGWTAHEAGDYERAYELHDKCWEWHRARKTGYGERIAKWSVAKQLRFLEREDEAMPMHAELLAEYAAEEPGGEGFVHEEMAEILLVQGSEEAAKEHFAKAHEHLKDINWIEAERLARMKELGEL